MDGHNIYFHTAHTAVLLQVSKKTIYRWKAKGSISCERDRMNGQYLFSLGEINRVRKLKVLPEITYDESVDLLADLLASGTGNK